MKNFSLVILAACILGLCVCEAVPADAGGCYAALEFTDPKSRLTQLVFQRCDSKSDCRKLNKDRWISVVASCPDCVKDLESCFDVLPDSYKGIYENKPIIFPYLSSEEDRIIHYGVPMKDAIRACKRTAESYKKDFNRPAVVIMPMDQFK
jgi:hypothetical protein